MLKWILENQILEYLFGPNIHVEVLIRSTDVLKFLNKHNRLTLEHLDIMWQPCQVYS